MATTQHISTPDAALAAVPGRRAFSNADGRPAFRPMLAHFRDEADDWRQRRRYTAHPAHAWRTIGTYGLRTIGMRLRDLAAGEAAARAPNPLSRAADAVDAFAAERFFHVGDLSRAYAVIAFADGRPALATGSHNAWAVVDAINAGRGSAETLAAPPAALAVQSR